MTKKKKGFFTKIIGKLDKKMEEKANKGCSCNEESSDSESSCCK